MELVSQKFEDIYKEYYVMLRNAANNIINDKDASHDIVQEVFLKLWSKKDKIDVILNQKAYLFKSVVNTSISYLDTKKNKVSINDIKSQSSESSDSNFNAKELELRIQTALNKLPPKCKAIFILSRFEEMKHKEIASTLGLSLKTVENQMGIALKKMKEEIGDYLNKEFISLIVTCGISFLLHLLSVWCIFYFTPTFFYCLKIK